VVVSDSRFYIGNGVRDDRERAAIVTSEIACSKQQEEEQDRHEDEKHQSE
jgi:hypothetical protein